MIPLNSAALALGISLFAGAAPPTVTHSVLHKRAVFDLVGGKIDLRSVCGGQEPVSVQYKRTAADVAAAIFSGLWYTPVHVQVSCVAPAFR
jgi:hypothetical protein